MALTIRLELPEPPSANRYWRHARGRTYVSAEAAAYRLAVRAAYATQHGTLRLAYPAGTIGVVLEWRRGRKRGDLDNRFKQIGDALNGLAYADDSQITEIHMYRTESPRLPSCTVTLYNTPCDTSSSTAAMSQKAPRTSSKLTAARRTAIASRRAPTLHT